MPYVPPLAATSVLVAATGVRLWTALRLLHGYTVEEYGSHPQARRLKRWSNGAVVVMVASILALAYCTTLRWVEAAGWTVLLGALGKLTWALWMRRSGRYVAYYRARQWK